MLQLFDKYFLTLVIVNGLVVKIIDCARYKRKDQEKMRRKASIISSSMIVGAIVLFVIRKTMG